MCITQIQRGLNTTDKIDNSKAVHVNYFFVLQKCGDMCDLSLLPSFLLSFIIIITFLLLSRHQACLRIIIVEEYYHHHHTAVHRSPCFQVPVQSSSRLVDKLSALLLDIIGLAMYSFSPGWRAICLVSLLVVDKVHCFQPSSLHHHGFTRNNRSLLTSSVRSTPPFVTRSGTTTTSSLASSKSNVEPQAIGTGYSQSPDLYTAIQEATDAALQALPKPLPQNKIDLGTIYVTSLYDNQFSPSQVVPAVLAECNNFYESSDNIVQKLVGCYSGGIVGSKLNYKGNASSNGISTENDNKNNSKVSSTMESEGMPGVVVTLCVLPDTNIKTFHVLGEDVPEDMGRMDLNMWKNSIGLKNFNDAASAEGQADKPTFMLLPSPSFQNDLDDFMRTMKMCFGPDQTIFGALASTVSSLSRARLFRFDVDEPGCLQTLADGCIGVAMTGDVKFNVMVAQGAKPVGGIYRVVAGMESTIGAIQLDEFATKQLEEEMDGEDEEEDDDDDGSENDAEKRKKFNAAQYAKAIIPKPVLAEANYIMKTLSDDDQAFMRKSLLIGLERGGGISKTPNELLRLAEGKGHSFQVIQVASAGMKDGSITLPLGSVDVQRGARLRFFVRDGGFAKREIEALWIGYKKRALEQSLFASSSASDDDDDDEDSSSDVFNPAGCFFFPTLDRGTKFFGESSFESSAISDYAPSLPSISGFFCNGAIASLDTIENKPMVHGSASCYVLIGSKSNRPVYSAEAKAQQDSKSEDEAKSEADDANNDGDDAASDILNNEDQPAPRSEDGELIVRRREIHSGRALTVSNVEWSVVENTATPSSALEGMFKMIIVSVVKDII